jgi:hypothetical protein
MVSGITRGLSGVILTRNRLTRGLSETGPIDAPGTGGAACDLGTWEAGDLRGRVGGVPRLGPTLPRSGRGCDVRGRGMAGVMEWARRGGALQPPNFPKNNQHREPGFARRSLTPA